MGGARVGVGADELAPQGSWSTDAANGKPVPASTAEWARFIAANGLAIGTPDVLNLLQEAAGDFADSSGNGLTLTATGTVAYAQPVAGWARKGFSTTDGVLGGARSTAAGLPDPSTTACLTLAYVLVSAIGGTRDIYEMGPPGGMRIAMLAANQVRAFDGANTATGVNDPRASVRPYVAKFDPVNAACVAYTNQEKLSPAFAALAATKSLTIGGTGTAPPTATYIYSASWFGVKAQMSDATVKALLQALTWVIPY